MSEAPKGAFAFLIDPVLAFFDSVGTQVLLTARTLMWMVRPPYRLVQLLIAMDFIGVQSIFIVALTGVFSGMVLALQTTHSLSQFGAEGTVGYIVAVSMTRELSPVFASLMVTARAGSGMAATLGNMRVTEQIDAITTMAISPIQYLLAPRLLAATLMVPLLVVLYTCVGMVGAYLVAVSSLGVDPGVFLSNIQNRLVPADFWMGIIKGAVFGFLIASIACRQGYFASGGARGVGEATTRAVVQSAVAILIANYLITSWLTDT